MNLGEWEDGDTMGRCGPEETMVRKYCMKKNIFNEIKIINK